MDPLDLTRLTPLMERTAGSRKIVVGLVDGAVDMGNPEFATEAVREVVTQSSKQQCGCSYPRSVSCRHGTFVAGILAGRRGSGAPAICPGCTLLVRTVFVEEEDPHSLPSTTPRELGEAITEMVQGGAKVVNLSCQLLPGSAGAKQSLGDALNYAAARGAICVAAAGNDGFLGSSAITRHRWVIPVAACDRNGRPADGSNLGHSIGQRGLLAPGEGIQSLGPPDQGFSLGGTSAAAPFVTGACALLWSEFPEADAADIWQAITQSGVVRRNSVVPPLLDAWGAYQSLYSRFGRPSHEEQEPGPRK
jgi:subtilisin family serine protease